MINLRDFVARFILA